MSTSCQMSLIMRISSSPDNSLPLSRNRSNRHNNETSDMLNLYVASKHYTDVTVS